ncbi:MULTISPECIES: hypothetical protein [unclassified Microcoleus]|nr:MULTISPECIES: hypothetical protein [unclassified Microcoleus]
MNSLILISPEQGSDFQPIISGQKSDQKLSALTNSIEAQVLILKI